MKIQLDRSEFSMALITAIILLSGADAELIRIGLEILNGFSR